MPGPTPNAPTTAHSVPQKVIERLFQLKQSLSILEDLGFSALDDDEDEDEDSEGPVDDFEDDLDDLTNSRHGLSKAEMHDILAELESGKYRDDTINADRAERMKRAKAKAKASAGSETKPPSTKKDKKSKSANETSSKSKAPKVKTPVFDLEEPEFVPSKPSTSSSSKASVSTAYGDPTALDATDMADKSARRKTLRFHTSRIEGASRRREGARSGALGGDDDLPWRDVRREKQAAKDRAIKEGRGGGGEDLDPSAPDVDMDDAAAGGKGKKRARDDEGDDGAADQEGADGYYELVKKRKKEIKEEKKAEYEAQRAANQYVFLLSFIFSAFIFPYHIFFSLFSDQTTQKTARAVLDLFHARYSKIVV